MTNYQPHIPNYASHGNGERNRQKIYALMGRLAVGVIATTIFGILDIS